MSTSPSKWNLERFYAPLYWGQVVAIACVGTTIAQGYIFFSKTTDSRTVQLAVMIIILLDISSTILMSNIIYVYFVRNFGNDYQFMFIPTSWLLQYCLTLTVTFMTQIFFASRIYFVVRHQYGATLHYDKILPAVIAVTAISAFASGIAKNIMFSTMTIHELSDILTQVFTCLEEGLAALSDIFATGVLCYVITSANGSIPRSPHRLRRLFFFILKRGILVTMIQVGTIVAFMTALGELYWMPFHLLKSKLYTNTLLAMCDRCTPKAWNPVLTNNELGLTLGARNQCPPDFGLSMVPTPNISASVGITTSQVRHIKKVQEEGRVSKRETLASPLALSRRPRSSKCMTIDIHDLVQVLEAADSLTVPLQQ